MTNARTAKSAREKAAALRAEAERKAARRRALIAGALVLVVIAVAVGVVVFVRSLPTHSAVPKNLVDGGILVGNKDAKVTMEIYEDFQCPVCKEFEKNSGSTVAELAKDQDVRVIYRPVAILDWASTTKYSTRALNMMAAVVDSDPSAFDAFHSSLFENQPPENSDGLPDSKLIELATAAGAPEAAMQTAAKDEPFRDWTSDVTDGFSKRFPNGGTPTVLVNGTQVKDPTPDNIKAEVAKAKG
jgi:protein-disulfide isomerase